MLDETEFLSDYGVRALSRVHRDQPYRFEHDGEIHRALRARRIDDRPVRRQLQLARPDLDAGELPAHRVAAEVPPLLRRRFQGRVPDRLRAASDDRSRSPTSCRAALAELFRATSTAAGRVRRRREAPERPALPRLRAVPRILPRRHRPRRRRVAPDRLDRADRQADPAPRAE